MRLVLQTPHVAGVVVLQVVPPLEFADEDIFKAQLLDLVHGNNERIVLDLSLVEHPHRDHATILLSLAKHLRDNRGSLTRIHIISNEHFRSAIIRFGLDDYDGIGPVFTSQLQAERAFGFHGISPATGGNTYVH